MKLKKLLLIICTICFTLALACGLVACGGSGGDDESIPVISITLDRTELELEVGDIYELKTILNPSNATNKTKEWSSSNPDVATVNKIGKVTAVAEGEAVITVTASGKEATCTVKVTEKEEEEKIPVSSVTLNKKTLEMTVGDTNVTIGVSVLPANATNRTVTWESDSAHVTVDEKGILTAVSVGTATIKATADGKSDECVITVYPKVDAIVISPDKLELVVGDKATLTATVTSDEDNIEVVWISSNEKVAKVDKGEVTAVAEGTATITAKVGNVTATCTVKVFPSAAKVEEVKLNKYEATIAVGSTEVLTATILPVEALDRTIEWTTSDSSVATVTNGVITGKKAGTAIIKAAVGDKSAECKVTVENVRVESVELNHDSLTMYVGDTFTTLVATVLPANATYKTVTWTSDSAHVTVDEKGVLKAVSVGSAKITATADGKSDTCTVTVENPPVTIIHVESVTLNNKSLTMYIGDTFTTLTATVLPANATYNTVSWSSSSDCVTVDKNGVLKAISAGKATITATADGKSDVCTVEVKQAVIPVTKITLNKTDLDLTEGDTFKLIATITPEDATETAIEWISSNKAVATVADDGTVTAVSVGTAKITAKIGDVFAECAVGVNAKDSGGEGEGDDNPTIPEDSIISYAYAGQETAAFEWADSNAKGAKVEYKLSSSSSYTEIDSELIRQISPTTARADIVGLKGGAKHDFRITASNKTVEEVKGVTITSHDRTGYGHVVTSGDTTGAKDGVGAYKNDGTLKSNAKVIYLTEANKNDIDGKGTSIAEYLKAGSKITTPVVIRVIGLVGSATWQEIKYRELVGKDDYLEKTEVKGINGEQLPEKETSQADLISGGYNKLNYYPAKLGGNVYCAAIDGLNSKATFSKATTDKPDRYDSCWNDCQVKGVKNITIEGVGEDAEIFQWGFTFNGCNSVEVRNIRFWDYTEDACSFEGGDNSTTLAGFTNRNFWIHHNVFDIGMNYWDICEEQDKGDGDGATDFKKLAYVTLAYNRYNDTHKTGLVGGGDTHYQACFTFHHNYYNQCDQRMPLGRQANMHIYNNYFYKSGLYSISLRAGAYAFIENCVFTSKSSSTKPIELVKGSAGIPSAKVIECEMEGNIVNGVGSAYLYYDNKENDRSATVEGDNKYGRNFELNMPYTIQSGTKLATSEVATKVPQLAGTQKHNCNIKIGGTTGGGDSGNTGGEEEPPVTNPDADKVTASIDSAVASGKLTVSTAKQDVTVDLTDKISFTAKQTTVSKNDPAVSFEGGYSFYHRVILGKYSSSNQRYFKIETDGAATIKVYAANMGSSDDRNLGLYTDKDSTNTLVGSTTEFKQGDIKVVTISVSAKGTYYLLATTAGSSADLSIFAIDIEEQSGGDSGSTTPSTGTTYKYTHQDKGDGWTLTDTGSNNSQGSTVVAGTKIEYNTTTDPQKNSKLTLTASGNKITITKMTGFTTSSGSALNCVLFTLKDAAGNAVGTITATTPTDKALGNYTFTVNTLTTDVEFASVEISCNTDGRHFSIVELEIVVE